jgi:hypothetical protein
VCCMVGARLVCLARWGLCQCSWATRVLGYVFSRAIQIISSPLMQPVQLSFHSSMVPLSSSRFLLLLFHIYRSLCAFFSLHILDVVGLSLVRHLRPAVLFFFGLVFYLCSLATWEVLPACSGSAHVTLWSFSCIGLAQSTPKFTCSTI